MPLKFCTRRKCLISLVPSDAPAQDKDGPCPQVQVTRASSPGLKGVCRWVLGICESPQIIGKILCSQIFSWGNFHGVPKGPLKDEEALPQDEAGCLLLSQTPPLLIFLSSPSSFISLPP